MKWTTLAATAATLAFAQDPEAGTRELFFKGLKDRDLKVTRLGEAAKPDFAKRAAHLGVRYNLALVRNPATRELVDVEPEHNFSKGDCVSLRFMPNRSGFLYVFNHGSSGAWSTVWPTEEMRGEPAVVEAWSQSNDLESLASRFDVSQIAMGWRLYSFGLAAKPGDVS